MIFNSMKYDEISVDEHITCIYGIYDKTTGECLYVGQTVNVGRRWREHMHDLRYHTHLKEFNEWFDSHSENDLDYRILELCDNNYNIKNMLERKWFNNENPLFYGEIPSGSSAHYNKLTDATKESISDSLLLWYANNGYTDISNIDVIGIDNHIKFTLKDIDKRACSVCGKEFYILSSWSWKECREHHSTNPHNKKTKRVVKIPDKYQNYSIDDLSDSDVKLIYDDMLFSVIDMSIYFECTIHAARKRVMESGAHMRSNKEAIEAKKIHTYDDIDVDKCIEMWKNGISIEKIAETLGVGKMHVSRFIHNNQDIFPNRNTPTIKESKVKRIKESDYPRIIKMRKDGYSWREIAIKFNVNKCTMLRIEMKMKKKGIIK